MVGHVQHNGSLHSLRSHQHTQSSGEADYLGNRIIMRVNSMPNIFHHSGITNPQKRTDDARRTEEQSVNQQASTKQPYEHVSGAEKGQPSYSPRKSIRENYSSRRGDLVYGLGQKRFELLQMIYGKQLKNAHIQCIDSMNVVKQDCARDAVYKGSANDEYTNFRKKHESFEDINAYIHTMRQQDIIGKKNQKFNIRKRFEDFYKLENKLIDAEKNLTMIRYVYFPENSIT